MKNLLQNILTVMVVIHFIGWGLSQYYYDWEYKNNHSAVQSFFLSGIISQIRGFFWEIDVIKILIKG